MSKKRMSLHWNAKSGAHGGSRGFTLLELMITIVIVAILASIAVPGYSDYVRRGKIAEATANLSDMRVKLEQFFQDNRTYQGACAAGTLAPLPPNAKYFTYTCPSLTATQYTVVATGVAGQGMADFSYQVNQSNTRATLALPAGWNTTNMGACWVLKKDGSC